MSNQQKQKKRGRPTKFTRAICDELVAARVNGESLTQACAKIGITRETANAWRKKYKSFSDAEKRAREASAIWWENTMRGISRGKKGNVTAAIFMMKNMFPDDYRDRKEVVADLSVKSSLEEWGKIIEHVERNRSENNQV
jgi:hypothetical protein